MQKNKNAYKTISEAAKEIGLINKKKNSISTHTLRFWEKNFKQLRPKVLSGNRRYYSKKDMDFLKILYELLKKQGFTIKGAKNFLNKKRNELDVSLIKGVNNKNFETNIKTKAQNIKVILNRIKKIN